MDEQYIVDKNGDPIDVILDIGIYRKILEELEELAAIRAYDVAKASDDEAIPFEQALTKIGEAGLPSLAKVPPEYQPELEALEAMSDEELWEMARSEMPTAQQDRLDHLLQKNQAEGLSEVERRELDQLHAEANRLMLQKSYAYVLLKWRGHQVPKLTGP